MALLVDSIGWTANICAGLSLLGFLYMTFATFAVLLYPRPKPTSRSVAPVTILKPLHGREPYLFSRLAVFCRQKYAGPVQLVCGTLDPADPSVAIANRLQALFHDEDIRIVSSPVQHGSNRKISNVLNMMPEAQHDILILCDSDIQIDPDYVEQIVGLLDAPDVGAVTCLYHGVPGGGLCSALSALAINTQFLPQAILAITFRLAQPCFGATVALTRTTLAEIGGFRSFADYLADDYVIGEMIRSKGLRIETTPFSVGHVCFETSMAELIRRQLRVARTIRNIDALGYAGSIITHPIPFALMTWLLGRSVLFPIAAIGFRMLPALAVAWRFKPGRQAYWLIPVQDFLSFLVFLLSFRDGTLMWRGFGYRLRDDGSLSPHDG